MLKKISFKSEYDSIDDDVYQDFFVRALSESDEYSRFGGIFSSKSLALCAEGMQKFI